MAVLPAGVDDLADELDLDFFDIAVLLRAVLDADWRTGTIPGFTVTGYASAWRLSYAGLNSSTKRLEEKGAIRVRRVRGHDGELEVLVYDRLVRATTANTRERPGATTADVEERNRESAVDNRESIGAPRESAVATCDDAPLPVHVHPHQRADAERQARAELAAKQAKGEGIDHPEGWVKWRAAQLEREAHDKATNRTTAARSLAVSRAGHVDEDEIRAELERTFPDLVDDGLAAYHAAGASS